MVSRPPLCQESRLPSGRVPVSGSIPQSKEYVFTLVVRMVSPMSMVTISGPTFGQKDVPFQERMAMGAWEDKLSGKDLTGPYFISRIKIISWRYGGEIGLLEIRAFPPGRGTEVMQIGCFVPIQLKEISANSTTTDRHRLCPLYPPQLFHNNLLLQHLYLLSGT